MVIALMLQRFRLRCKEGYKLQLISLLTVKPDNLQMGLKARDPKENLASSYEAPAVVASSNTPQTSMSTTELIKASLSSRSLSCSKATISSSITKTASTIDDSSLYAPILPATSVLPLYIYYASNMGACKDFANQLKIKARASNLEVHCCALDSLIPDLAKLGLSTNVNVIVIASTYNGAPPDNAKLFNSKIGNGDLSFVNVFLTLRTNIELNVSE